MHSQKFCFLWIGLVVALLGGACAGPTASGSASVKLSFDKNDSAATGTMAPASVSAGSTATLPAFGFHKVDWLFDGWAASPSGARQWFDQGTVSVTGDTTFYARWKNRTTQLFGAASTVQYVTALGTDPRGNLLAAQLTSIPSGLSGFSMGSALLTSTSPDGTVNWSRVLSNQANDRMYLGRVVAGPNGDVFAVGTAYGPLLGFSQTYANSRDLLVVKYSSLGTLAWVKQFEVQGKQLDLNASRAVAVDASGNVYVGGSFSQAGNGTATLAGVSLGGSWPSGFVMELNSTGQVVWVRQVSSPAGQVSVESLGLDAAGNLYAAGTASGALNGQALRPGSSTDGFVVKYDTSATVVSTTLLGDNAYQTALSSLVVEPSGALAAVGWTNGDLDTVAHQGTKDLLTVRYNADGSKRWLSLLGGANLDTEACGLVIDPAGSVRVAAYSTGQGSLLGQSLQGIAEGLGVIYSADGVLKYVDRRDVSGATIYPNAITLDANHQTLIGGGTTKGFDSQTLTGVEDGFLTSFLNP